MKKRFLIIIISITSFVVVIVLLPSSALATPGPFGWNNYLSQIVDFARGPIAYTFSTIGLILLAMALIFEPRPGIIRKIIIILFGLLIIATSLNITSFFGLTPGLAF
jgi:type IV secretory pathway VirB2 component (pilin)